jgi:single-stranded-DNA-specific exonuclease
VLANPDWHQGILGLVASRLCDRHWKPAFVFGKNGSVMRGSARSVPGFALNSVLQECEDLLSRYGGHAGAAGLSLPPENLGAFRERIGELADRELGGGPAVPELSLDGLVDLQELSQDLVHEIKMLGPFGRDNIRPVFAASGLQLAGNPTIVGSSRNHLTFMARQGDTTLRTIGMGKADWLHQLRVRKGEPFSLAFEPVINSFRGRTTVELRLEDMQWDDDPLVETRT